ncbi:serine protease [Methylotenera sp. N17]|uniref:serine protease n=1 Tax=Methylotenera sp. N17 TaxID=1502761 RepID=UPI0006461C9D|nr:serine protease [Methylotenera sp. N17]
MAKISLVSEKNEFVKEYMPVLIRIDRTGEFKSAEQIWMGTVFVVGIQMLFTAKHVALQLFKDDPELEQGKPGRFQYSIIQTYKGNRKLILWDIHSIGMINNCDIALITLRAAHEDAKNYTKWNGLALSFIPPRIGDKIAGSGIHEITINQLQLEDDSIHLDIDVKRLFSEGVVNDVHFDMRDRGLYSFPCFQVDAQFNRGMSGGYVVNEKSEVCGVISGSLPAASTEEAHVSYAALLWPVVSLPIPPEWMANPEKGVDYYLWDYFQQSDTKPLGLDRVKFSNNLVTDGTITSSYTDPTN